MKSSKIIDISKASLVSLKAELSRKHEEVNKAKSEAQASFIRPVPHQRKLEVPKKEFIEKDVEKSKEDEELHRKSRTILEAKAKLYDRLTQASTSQEEGENSYLVDFEQKQAENKSNESPGKRDEEEEEDIEVESIKHDSDNSGSSCESDDEWVDYTDCLGRTRRCLKCDLDFVKEKDVQLANSLGFYVDKKGTEDSSVEKHSGPLNPDPSSNNLRLEHLRKKWEEQEELLKDKADIHYQDVLFDEARSHGVGYFAFAQDEDTRRQQQEALSRLRDDTKRQQEAAKETRQRREQALKARVRAARNRQRARMGLPPERQEEIEDSKSKETEDEDAKRTAMMEADKLAKQEEEQRKLQTLRAWDVGKDKKKPFEEMSQEEWVKKKRQERNEDFAPPQLYQNNSTRKESSSKEFDSRGNFYEIGPSPPSETKHTSSSLAKQHTFPQAGSSLISNSQSTVNYKSIPPCSIKSKFYNRVRPAKEDVLYNVEPKLQKIVNEVSNPIESSSDEEAKEESEVDCRRRGVEIAPPTSCEYYGLPPMSVTRKGKRTSSNMSEIEKSISIGLKFLRKQQERKEQKMENSTLDFL